MMPMSASFAVENCVSVAIGGKDHGSSRPGQNQHPNTRIRTTISAAAGPLFKHGNTQDTNSSVGVGVEKP